VTLVEEDVRAIYRRLLEIHGTLILILKELKHR